MKKLLLIISIAISISAIAQDDKTVTLVVSGQGKTQDEAKQNALRSAIEQAFGTFISSKTEILNDKLVKDEIVSVANGNIQKFEVISEVQIPDGGYATTLKAIVSVTKLTSFVESKGVEVEFKGALFLANIKMQQLNEKNEVVAIKNLCSVLKPIADKCFDYTISNSDPTSVINDPNKWQLEMTVGLQVNNNFYILRNYLFKTLCGIAMNDKEVENYSLLNKKTYQINLFLYDSSTVSLKHYPFKFRQVQSIGFLQDLIWYLDFSQANFIINDGLSEFTIYDISCKKEDYDINKYHGISYDYSDYCVFGLQRKFNTSWTIYCNSYGSSPGQDFWHQDDYFGPPWGTASLYCGSNMNGPECFSNEGCTYEKTKENIYGEWNRLNQQLKHSQELVADWIKTSPNYQGISKQESYIKEALIKITSFSDSVTVIKMGKSWGYYDETGKRYFSINLTPPKKKYGEYIIQKIYTTDELGKISLFKIIPSPQLLNLEDSPEWLKWFSASLKIGSDRNKAIKILIENNFSKKSISDVEIKFVDLGLNIKDYPEWNNWFQENLKINNVDRNLIIETLFENGFSEKSIIEAGKDFNFKRLKYGCYEYNTGFSGASEKIGK